ncbi:uncharacterized protein LOC113762947 [Coffea eugenioides]|uniref:uncharacterized protein LOC113762947 n=1 Tax=Coffea eugenioides TaxID=49369 RepID=UPI000F605FC2|nr:uncharacterized protein LOC113762947 [Coffea eugenioides]
MAYRRRQQLGKASTFKEEIGSPYNPAPPPPLQLPDDVDGDGGTSSPSASSLAAKAIRASSAHHDSSLSSAYGQSAFSSPRDSNPLRSSSSSSSSPKGFSSYEYTSMKSLNEPKQGFWGVLARKAKAIIDDDNASQQHETPGRTTPQMSGRATRGQYDGTYSSYESRPKKDSPTLQKGLGALASSLNYIGGTIGNALEEGLAVVENRTADIIQETRKLQIRKKGSGSIPENQTSNTGSFRQQPLGQTHVQPRTHAELEIQLKASRDVAMAMAAKAKLLLRELKTVKADLAFAKERCAQLEEENRILRESREKGDNPEDDDLIRLQLETLLAEKARLAQENSVFARENRFLREIVEYHQLTMQDVVYLDEGTEEVTEVYPVKVPSTSNLLSLGTTPPSLPLSLASPFASHDATPLVTRDIAVHPVPSSEPKDVFQSVTPLSSYIPMPNEDLGRH